MLSASTAGSDKMPKQADNHDQDPESSTNERARASLIISRNDRSSSLVEQVESETTQFEQPIVNP